jgi:hypothetical protein
MTGLRVLALAGVVALCMGCGSTVQGRSTAGIGAATDPAGAVEDTGIGAPAAAGTAAGPSRAGGSAPDVTGSTSGSRSAEPVRGAAPPAGSNAGAASQPASTPLSLGPGVTATSVSIGILHDGKTADHGAQFGAKGLASGDMLAMQKAVAAYINAHGGVAKRRIELVPYDVAGGGSAQAICTAWTEDHHVFAGVNPGGQITSDTMAGCMAKHRSVFVQSPFVPGDAAFFKQFAPYYYTPRSFESVTMGRDFVVGLADQGYFQGDHKIGLAYYDLPAHRAAIARGLVPALKQRGLSLKATAAIHYPASDSESGDTISAIQGAVLKFASEGIDRVMFLDTGAGVSFFFIQSANSQGYHPKYGLESGSHPQFLAENFDAASLAGSIGVGWVPPADLSPSGLPATPARALCRQIMNDAGHPAKSSQDSLLQFDICSIFFFLKAGLDAAAAPSPSGFREAMSSLGDVPAASASSLGDGFGPDKPWGTRYYSALAYVAGCSCFRYRGSPHRV